MSIQLNVGSGGSILKTNGTGDEAQNVIIDSSALPSGAATQTTLADVLAKLIASPATEASLAALLAELQLKADLTQTQPVSVSGVSTETTLAQILAKLIASPATEATLAALLAELALKADLTETQPVSLASVPSHAVTGPLTNTELRATAVPVSAASLPLPTGAATQTTLSDILAKIIAAPSTEATLAQLLTELQLKADLTETQPVSMSGVATQTTLAQILTELQLKADLTERQPVSMAQTVDSGNTQTITSAQAQPGNPWIGTWTQTRSLGIVRQLIVLASTSSSVGGTFTFEYGENGTTATISEARVITDFATVRDFDLLNAGEYFRVKFEPAAALGANSVFLTTTNRRQNDGAFVRLANQEIEEANSAMGGTFSYVKGFDQFSGKSVNIRASGIDTPNSSETLLAGAATFTGTAALVTQGKGITCFVASDVSGTLTIQFAKNIADFSDSSLVSTINRVYTAGAGQGFVFSPIASYYRVKYLNGASVQTKFRLQTILHHAATGPIFTRLDNTLVDGALAQQTRAVLVGRKPDATYDNCPSNERGNIITANFLTEVRKGNVAGHSLVNQTGFNPDIDTAFETVWGAGGVYTFPVIASTLSVISTSALDTAAGTGARTLTITGLNSSYVEVTETITLAGPVAVLTSGSFIRVNSAFVATAGAGAANDGEITCTRAATTMFTIAVGFNRTQLGVYTVPAAFTAYLMDLTLSVANTSSTSLSGVLWIREFGGLFQRRDNYGGHSQGGNIARVYSAPIRILEKSDMRIDALGGAINNEVSASFNLLLVAN